LLLRVCQAAEVPAHLKAVVGAGEMKVDEIQEVLDGMYRLYEKEIYDAVFMSAQFGCITKITWNGDKYEFESISKPLYQYPIGPQP
jgi:hypothetical protein